MVDELEQPVYTSDNQNFNGHSENIWDKYSLPLYEELLKTTSQHPEKLRSIDELISKLKAEEKTKEFISPELSELWNTFKPFIK